MDEANEVFRVQVKKALIDRKMNVTKLAEELRMSREHVSSVINGSVQSKAAKRAICNYLNITA